MVRPCDFFAGVILGYGIDEAVAIVIWVRGEVRQGSSRAAGVLVWEEVVAEVGPAVVLEELVLGDTAPVRKGPTPVTALNLNVLAEGHHVVFFLRDESARQPKVRRL